MCAKRSLVEAFKMLRGFLVFVFLVATVSTEVASQTDGDCTQNDGKFECRCRGNQNFQTEFLQGDEGITELAISDCTFVELGQLFFLIANHPLQKITFRNIETLAVLGTFPSQLRELHVDKVGLTKLSNNIFAGDTRLQKLQIHDSTIDEIKQDTFELVAVENAHFKNVTFKALEVDALAFSLNMTQAGAKDHAVISFHGCRFPDVEVATVWVAEPGIIKFVDNILRCDSLAQTYDWLHQMIGEHKTNYDLCHYLDGNFCESKRDGNKVIRRLFASGLLSNKIGTSLPDLCPRLHQEYLEEMKMTGSANEGWLVRANLPVSLCFVVVLLAK